MPRSTKLQELLKVTFDKTICKSKTTQLWADGGVVLKSRSEYGGSWAYVLVGPDDIAIDCASGFVPAPEGKTVTNNTTEMIAVLKGFEQLPDGWAGEVCTDSLVTLTRLWKISRGQQHQIKHVPGNVLQKAVDEVKRLGRWKPVLVKGHPRIADLEAQVYLPDLERDDIKRVVSKYNVLCDDMCNREIAEYWKRQPETPKIDSIKALLKKYGQG